MHKIFYMSTAMHIPSQQHVLIYIYIYTHVWCNILVYLYQLIIKKLLSNTNYKTQNLYFLYYLNQDETNGKH